MMSSPTPSGRSPRTLAVVALILIGAFGAVVGFALDRTVMSPCQGGRFGERAPYWIRSSEEVRARWHEISRTLHVTPEQSVRIDSVLSEQSRVLDAARGEIEPRMKGIMRMTRARIDSLLTPEQKAQLEKMRKERESRRKHR